MIRATIVSALALMLAGVVALSVYVEVEAPYRFETLHDGGEPRAVVLYHPSRDARFSDEISLAVAEGLATAGLAVDRATLGEATPAAPEGYALVVVVSNTFYWTPDLPTLAWLRRAELDGVPAAGVMLGAGATRRSERLLQEGLLAAGAPAVQTRSLWLWRPNDDARADEPNREVALDIARRLGAETGRAVLGR